MRATYSGMPHGRQVGAEAFPLRGGAGAHDLELRGDELWWLAHAHIRCLPFIPFSDTSDLSQRIDFGGPFGETMRQADDMTLRCIN